MTTVSISEMVAEIQATCIGGKMTHGNPRTKEPSWRGVVENCRVADDIPFGFVVDITDAEIATPEEYIPYPEKNGPYSISLLGWVLSLKECPHFFNWDTGEVVDFRPEGWSPLVVIEKDQ